MRNKSKFGNYTRGILWRQGYLPRGWPADRAGWAYELGVAQGWAARAGVLGAGVAVARGARSAVLNRFLLEIVGFGLGLGLGIPLHEQFRRDRLHHLGVALADELLCPP